MNYSISTAPILHDPAAITFFLDADTLTEMVADVLWTLPHGAVLSTSRLVMALKRRHGRALPPADDLQFDLTRLARTVCRPVVANADRGAVMWAYEHEWRVHPFIRSL